MRIGQQIERLSERFILLWGWQRAGWSVIAGVATALALPPIYAFLVPFLTVPIFIWLMDATAVDPARSAAGRFLRGLATGWCFGFGYFLAGLWWIGVALLVEADKFAYLLPLAVAGLPALLGLFWGISCGVAALAWREGWPRVPWFAACMSAGEYLRGQLLTGFPWNEIGIAAMPHALTMQSASLMGTHGVTLLAICCYGVAAAAPFRAAGARAFASFCAAAIAAHVGYGGYRLATTKAERGEGVTVRLVQPATPQDEKWSGEFADRSFRKLLDLSGGDPSGLAGIALLVWPESAFAFVLTERPDALGAIADLLPADTMLVTGALRLERGSGTSAPRAFNSVYVINGAGEIVASSDKAHLVPFGEYVPFAWLGETIGLTELVHSAGGTFAAGRAPAPLEVGGVGQMLALVCYEILFPALIFGSPRPDFLVNVTNDAWFGNTPGPRQHWHQALIRSVEFGLPLVRAANSGISSVSDPLGRVVARLPVGATGSIDAKLPAALPPTPYARWGDIPFLAMLILLAAVGLLAPAGTARSRQDWPG